MNYCHHMQQCMAVRPLWPLWKIPMGKCSFSRSLPVLARPTLLKFPNDFAAGSQQHNLQHSRFLATALLPGLKSGISPLHAVRGGMEKGALRHDERQLAALHKLERLHSELQTYTPPPMPPPPEAAGKKEWRGPQFDEYGTPVAGGTMYTGVGGKSAAPTGFFAQLGAMFGGGSAKKPPAEPQIDNVAAPRGVYMYGGVGCGKSFVMDTFFLCAPVAEERKKRLHFNEFMLDVHKRMHELRMKQPDFGDPLPLVAHDIASSTQLLCFDEFQVTDVADALVMRRLFRHLFSYGLVMVATSNRAPDKLYLNGIQRQSFLPFIADLKARCEVHDLESQTDYRMLAQVSRGARTYLHPLGEGTTKQLDALFADLTAGHRVSAQTLQLRGREVQVPVAGVGVARFSFSQLCGRPLGAEDYLGIASAFHTVFVENVPQLTLNEVNQVRRLITLVDAFYDKRVRLFISAAVPMEQLFSPTGAAPAAGHGDLIGTAAYVPNASDEVFAFDRTLSRLKEMSSHEYLGRTAGSGERSSATFMLYANDSVLSPEKALALFKAYDVDASGVLELAEVKLLMEDLCETRKGHRNVLDEEVQQAFDLMDVDGSGDVTPYEFVEIFANSKLANVQVLEFGDTLPDEVTAQRPARAGRVSRAI